MKNMPPSNFTNLCRLCLVKDKVSIPIFEGEGEIRNIFMKIVTCLPVKVDKDDKLPKKICDVCLYNVENVFKFWHTTASSEKKLLQWLEEPDEENIIDNLPLQTEEVMLKEESLEEEQEFDNDGVEESERSPDIVEQSDESNSGDEVNSEVDVGDDGDRTVQKEEVVSEDDEYGELEPTTFVNVTLACEEQAGPSGLQELPDNTENKITTIQSSIGLQPQVTQVILHPIQSIQMQPVQTVQQVQEDAVPSTSNEASASSGYSSIRDSSVSNPKETIRVKNINELKIKTENSNLNEKMSICLSQRSGEMQENGNIVRMKSLVCGSDGESFGHLEEHMKNHMNSRWRFKCEVCNKMFRRITNLKDHVSTHSNDRPFECDVCHQKFRNRTTLTRHKKNKHSRGRQFVCDICNYTSSEKFIIERHRKRHLKQYTHFCDVCNKGFYLRSALKGHMKVHTGGFECDVCLKSFQSNFNLIRHKKTHDPDHENNNILCSICGKKLRSTECLKRHLAYHKGRSVKVCDICGKTVTALQSHRRTHTGEKPYGCSFCQKTFSAKETLKCHLRVHTGERPFSCDMCGKTFNQLSNLTVHKRYHTGVRPYKCICGKQFVTKTQLNYHRKKCQI